MGLKLQPGAAALGIHGRLSLTVVRPDGTVRDRREGDNIMCTAGVSAIAAALVWSGVQDQATALGLTSPVYLTPLWGAVGSGAGTVAASDVALFSELGRQTVGAGANGPATASIPASVTWLFYFPQPATTWTVTEAGVFANGSSNAGSPQSAGVMLDHWAVSPSVVVPTTDTLILQSSFSFTGM
ncbi:hypothetical protein [Streptacidiphilus sp. PAMC 29251]